MADTVDAFDIGKDWTNLNTLSGVAVGNAVILQNVGGPNDIIDTAISVSQPAADFNGIRLEQNQFYSTSAGDNDIWVRYIRLDRQNIGTRTTKIQVQE